jgi:hypothetical protein
LAKLEGYGARFALLHHVVTEVAAGRDALAPVGPESVQAGIDLAGWFAAEARRIYFVLAESDDEREERELEEWVRGRPASRCTARDLQKSRGGSFPTADAAEIALQSLVDHGRGTWKSQPNPNGGWSKKEFVLSTFNDTDTCDTRPAEARPGMRGCSDTRTDTRSATPEKTRGNGSSVASVGVVERTGRGDGDSQNGSAGDGSFGPSVAGSQGEEGEL